MTFWMNSWLLPTPKYIKLLATKVSFVFQTSDISKFQKFRHIKESSSISERSTVERQWISSGPNLSFILKPHHSAVCEKFWNDFVRNDFLNAINMIWKLFQKGLAHWCQRKFFQQRIQSVICESYLISEFQQWADKRK